MLDTETYHMLEQRYFLSLKELCTSDRGSLCGGVHPQRLTRLTAVL